MLKTSRRGRPELRVVGSFVFGRGRSSGTLCRRRLLYQPTHSIVGDSTSSMTRSGPSRNGPPRPIASLEQPDRGVGQRVVVGVTDMAAAHMYPNGYLNPEISAFPAHVLKPSTRGVRPLARRPRVVTQRPTNGLCASCRRAAIGIGRLSVAFFTSMSNWTSYGHFT